MEVHDFIENHGGKSENVNCLQNMQRIRSISDSDMSETAEITQNMEKKRKFKDIHPHVGNRDTFPLKLFQLLNDVKQDDIVMWMGNGDFFKVFDKKRFLTEIVPKYFRHTKYKSFLKQMSVYGFEKLGERNDWCFYHCHFRRNYPDKLVFITRDKMDEDPSSINNKKRIYQAMMSENGNRLNSKKVCENASNIEKKSLIPMHMHPTSLPMHMIPQPMLNPYSSAIMSPMSPHPYSSYLSNHIMANAIASNYYPNYNNYNNNYPFYYPYPCTY